jgi:cytochrome c553
VKVRLQTPAPSSLVTLTAALAAIALAACGGSNAAETQRPGVPFGQLSHEQRISFMKQVVVPEMRAMFQRFDPVEFAEFDCQTCHGPDVKKGEFEMPTAALPKLNFQDPAKMDAKVAEFMKTQVTPAMARLLQEPMYTPQNPKGFGCLGCHTMEAAEEPAGAATAAPSPASPGT